MFIFKSLDKLFFIPLQEGEVLARLEVEKRQAIECENYELAKLKKLQMDERRMVVYREMGIGSLLEDVGVSSQTSFGFESDNCGFQVC